jgi:hypothetical protein
MSRFAPLVVLVAAIAGCPSATPCPLGTVATEGGLCVAPDAGLDAALDASDGAMVPDAVDDDVPVDDVPVDTCVPATYYADEDGDEHGDATVTMDACTPPDGYVAVAGDCDDDDERRYEGLAEVCDGIDNDCDEPMIDEDFDCAQGATVACTTACGSTGSGACTDACELPVDDACAPPAESCDADAALLDDDCDGQIDEGLGALGSPITLGTTAADRMVVVPVDGGYVAVTARTSGVYAQRLDADGAATGSELMIASGGGEMDAYSTGSQVLVSWYAGKELHAAVLGADLSVVTTPRMVRARDGFEGVLRVGVAGSTALFAYYDGGNGRVVAFRRAFPGLTGSTANVVVDEAGRNDLSIAVDETGDRAWVVYQDDGLDIAIRALRVSTTAIEGTVGTVASSLTAGVTLRAPDVRFSAEGGRRRLAVTWLEDATTDRYRFALFGVALDGTRTAATLALLDPGTPPTGVASPLDVTWFGGRWLVGALVAGSPASTSTLRVFEVTEPESGPLVVRASSRADTATHTTISMAAAPSAVPVLGVARTSGGPRVYPFGCP